MLEGMCDSVVVKYSFFTIYMFVLNGLKGIIKR
jgi:hypothetical protein